MAIRVEYHLTLADVLELNCHLRGPRVRGWLTMALSLLLAAFGNYVHFFATTTKDATPVFIGAGVVFVIGMLGTRIAGIGAWFLKTPRHPQVIEVSPQGINGESGIQSGTFSWGCVSRWFMTKNLLVLVIGSDPMAIPKRSCGQAEWDEFVQIVRAAIGERAGW